MNNLLLSTIIETMQRHLPKGIGLAPFIMDILSLSRESAYRRLRGDVPFTFEEIVKISQKLGFSLDNLAAENKNTDEMEWAVTDTNSIFLADNHINRAIERSMFLSKLLSEIRVQKGAIIRSATNFIPYSFMAPFKKLTLFHYYRWEFLTQGIKPDFLFSDIKVPDNLLSALREVISNYLGIPQMILILDRNIFNAFANDIQYFYNRKLISENEFLELKDELLNLTYYMENIAETGIIPKSQTKIDIFLADISLSSSYMHIESESMEFALNWIYNIEYGRFFNSKVCQSYKSWIDLLKRYSTLISQTGETQRFEFFKLQRELIDKQLSINPI